MAVIDIFDVEWETSLHRAVAVGTKQEIEELMKPSVNVNVTNWKGTTPLHQALTKKRDIDIVKKLLRHGANVNLVDDHGDSPLHLAIFNCGTAEIVKELLEYGADSNVGDLFGTTPLQLAVLKGTPAEIVDELLEHGANVNVTDSDGSTPLHQCLFDEGDIKIIKGLLKWGAKVDVPNGNGVTPLHLAARCNGFVGYIRELLKHKGDVNVTDYSSRTPLHRAVSGDADLKIVKELLVHGADIHMVDKKGYTPLDLALKIDNVKMVNEIFKYGLNGKLDSSIWNKLLRKLICKGYAELHIDAKPLKKFSKSLIKYALFHTIECNSNNPFDFNPYRRLKIYKDLISYFDDCITELVKMRTVEVKTGLSLYNFVASENINTSLYSDSEHARTVDEDNLIAIYPIYKKLIIPKVNYALDRAKLMSELKQVYVYTRNNCSLNKYFREKVVLDDHSTANIAKYLCNDDLLNFGLAFYMQHK